MAENESKNVKEKKNTLGKSALMAWAIILGLRKMQGNEQDIDKRQDRPLPPRSL